MRDGFTILMIGLVLAASVTPAPTLAANRDARTLTVPSRTLARTQLPTPRETCRPKWPYIVLTCVA